MTVGREISGPFPACAAGFCAICSELLPDGTDAGRLTGAAPVSCFAAFAREYRIRASPIRMNSSSFAISARNSALRSCAIFSTSAMEFSPPVSTQGLDDALCARLQGASGVWPFDCGRRAFARLIKGQKSLFRQNHTSIPCNCAFLQDIGALGFRNKNPEDHQWRRPEHDRRKHVADQAMNHPRPR